MKTAILSIAFLVIYSTAVCATMSPDSNRMLDAGHNTRFGNIALRLTNYGIVGEADDDIPSLEWPRGSGVNYLYKGSLWFGGKVHRTNEEGEILYWLHWPPEDESDYVTEDDPLWYSGLPFVIDTLTSEGCDGDSDIMELLPAYNPVEESLLGELYQEYNASDVLTMAYLNRYIHDDDADGLIDEDSPGRAFVYPDPDGNYCFSIPYDDDADGQLDEDGGYPGLETGIGYCYDISPFGTDVDRDWGSYISHNDHFPLGIAVEQRVYAWNNLSLADAVILHFKITNVGANTIYDYALSYYLDADIKPLDSGDEGNDDDVSTYMCSEDYEFACSYDADFDDGETPGYIAVMTLGEDNHNHDCWTWECGDGPEDKDPRDLTPYAATANEKYWLQTGRNPEMDYYTSLIDDPEYQFNDPRDTRFMYSVFGDQQGFDDPTENSFNLEPGETRDFFVALFMADSEEGLIGIHNNLAAFYESDFDLSMFEDEPAIPVIMNTQAQQDGQSIRVNFYTGNIADNLYICFKQNEHDQWMTYDLDVNAESFLLENLAEETDYNIKIAAEYDDIYLESTVVTLNTYDYYDVDPNTAPPVETGEMSVYPNPFNPSTTIAFSLPESGDVTLDIYNIRGEKVKSLLSEHRDSGNHLLPWDGSNDKGSAVASGIYFARLITGNREDTCKLLLLK